MPDPNVKQLGECPDLRLIAAYVDARLSESERATLHRHLAACDSCTELVAEIVAANDAAFVTVPAPLESSDRQIGRADAADRGVAPGKPGAREARTDR